MNFKIWKSFKLINILFKSFCFLACIYQASMISQMYFSYKTTSNVKFETGKFRTLPGLTFCYEKKFQLKEKYLWNTSLDKINSWSIEEQRDKFVQNMRFMLACTIKYKVNCSEVTEIIGRFDQDMHCFTIFAQLNGEPDDRYLVSEEISFKLMLSIFLQKQHSRQNPTCFE